MRWFGCPLIRLVPLDRDPAVDLGPAGERMAHDWLRNVYASSRESWNLWTEIEKSGLTFSAWCYLLIPTRKSGDRLFSLNTERGPWVFWGFFLESPPMQASSIPVLEAQIQHCLVTWLF